MIPQRERRYAQAVRVLFEIVGANAAIEDVGLVVDVKDRRFVERFEDVAEAQPTTWWQTTSTRWSQ